MPPTLVETATPTSQAVEDRFETVGSLDADEAVTVVSEIGGVVTRIPFNEGGRVGKGDLIALIDDSEAKAELDRANALRDQALATSNRVKSIVDQGAGSQQTWDDASAALKVAEANAAYAQARFNKTRITAPFGGIVGARRISPGTYVQPGQAIADLARVEELRVNFSVPERFISSLKKGAPVSVTTTAFPGAELRGTVDVVEPMVDTGTRSVKVVAKVKNTDGKFRPGMSANVSLSLSERGQALTLISEAIFLDQNQAFVYVIKPDCTVVKTAVKLGSRTLQAVEIVEGVRGGDKVVKAGHQKLFEGAKVIPVSSIDSAHTAQAAQAAAAKKDSGVGK
jgi:membrane fusion protein (multidrug efflux system)